ncbi:short chain dehydrogenase [Stachybotrys elegans]|uniref:Short chain dehydrogenase n=1 Tax=Stachybotrys elegans TaxID=80388 RepID=A0A8K0WR21_9HYPO|nr:short chain dehydrogenase [Stachybotrys elegans]
MSVSKVFIVTGASKGIGAAVVQSLLKQSHKVVLTARSQDLLESVKTAHPGQAEYVAGDITDSGIITQVVDAAIKSFGRLDGVVINHGLLESKKLGDTVMEQFKRLYDVNVHSCLALAQASLPELRKTKGCLIWISSGAATKAYTAWGAYGSSKAAVNSLSMHIAVEEPDVTSIALSPGRVDTDMQALIRSAGKDSMVKEEYDDFVNVFESGGLLKPEQPGAVIAKLVADPAKELSGKLVKWDGPELAKYRE